MSRSSGRRLEVGEAPLTHSHILMEDRCASPLKCSTSLRQSQRSSIISSSKLAPLSNKPCPSSSPVCVPATQATFAAHTACTAVATCSHRLTTHSKDDKKHAVGQENSSDQLRKGYCRRQEVTVQRGSLASINVSDDVGARTQLAELKQAWATTSDLCWP